MDMETISKCRTCLTQGTQDEISTKVGDRIGCYDETYRDLILHLVPSMEPTLSDDNLICFTCKRVLKTTKKFINVCLTVEQTLVEQFEKQIDQDEEEQAPVIVPVESLENVDLENPAEIVENIEIVVEDDVNELMQKSKQSQDQIETRQFTEDEEAHTSMIDHAYIKTETDDLEGVEDGEVLFQHDEYDSSTVPEESEAMETSSMLGSEDEGHQYVLVEQGDNSQDGMQDQELSLEQLQELAEGSTGEVSNDGHVIIKQERQPYMEDESSQEQSASKSKSFLPGGGMCDICGKAFSTVQHLNKHLASHEDKRVQCPTCPKIFRSEIYLNRHINLVHKVDDLGLRYLCMTCNKLFKNKGALNAHYRLKHLKLEPFKCDECGESFGRADYLKKHQHQHRQFDEGRKANSSKVPGKFLRFKNTGTDEPLPCKICGKFYNGIHKLKVHLQTHVVVKRYACDYCDLTYKRWPSLKRHEKTHLESDGMFYRCNVCWKRMPTQEELQMHMTQHGNPRYRCHVCNQQFHRKYLFDNHYLLEHATPEDLELSKKEIIYDTLLELANQNQEDYTVPENTQQEQDVE